MMMVSLLMMVSPMVMNTCGCNSYLEEDVYGAKAVNKCKNIIGDFGSLSSERMKKPEIDEPYTIKINHKTADMMADAVLTEKKVL